jgi:4-hydroxybenzoate polyprenyltransferase
VTDILEYLATLGVDPSLAGAAATCGVVVRSLVYPLAKRAKWLPREYRSYAVLVVMAVAGVAVSYGLDVPVLWGLSAALSATAVAMLEYDAAKCRKHNGEPCEETESVARPS